MPVVNRARGAAERKVVIPEFKGIDQSRGIYNKDYGTSPDAVNFIARDGVLRTAGGTAQYGPDITYTTDSETPNSKPRLFQTYFPDSSGNPVLHLIASFNRKLHLYNPGTNTWSVVGTVTKDGCDLVSYRNADSDWAILTDGNGATFKWDHATNFAAMPVTQGGETIYFERIVLLYERLWGAVFKDAPDRIYWSKAYLPDDWEFTLSESEDEGGFLDLPTFDGSKVRAVETALGDVVVFKDRSIHRVSGTYPGEFQTSQVYGVKGTISPRTIINTGSKVYFLSNDGFCVYDGMSVSSLRSSGDQRLKDAWASMDFAKLDKACAVMYNNVIYLSVCLDDEESANTHVIEYDTVSGYYSIVEAPGIDDFLVLRDGLQETLLAIAWNKVYRYDSGATLLGQPIEAVWTSPEIDFGTAASKKSVGEVYMRLESTSLDPEADATVKLSMISGDKTRERIVTLKTGINIIKKRIRIRGRSFRFKIENTSGNPLTIYGGIEIMVEEDTD